MKLVNRIWLVGAVVSVLSVNGFGATYYVNPGESIQTGINGASYGDTVEVAAGTYTQHITLKNGVVLIGAGESNTTIDGNYASTVVSSNGCDANTVLEGFTITHGNASNGGGMHNTNSEPTIVNCAFTGNTAENGGGGMYNDNSSPALSDCTFSQNATEDDGGGMYNNDSSNPVLTDCTFSQNTAVGHGGGVHNYSSSSPALTDCTFNGNTADSGGGGMRSRQGSSPIVTNCTFTGNHANNYGGAMNVRDSVSMITNCSFIENTASKGGGAMRLNPGSNLTITNCIFTRNSAAGNGGGMNYNECSPTITNCTFTENSAGSKGGGIRNGNSSPTFTNCTFTRNAAGNKGGAMHNTIDSHPILYNCILWADNALSEGPELSLSNNSSYLVSHSDVQGGWPGIGNINRNPVFANAAGGDLHLLATSPCVDAGDPNYVAGPNETDLDGNPRIMGGRIDMGAYEYPNAAPVADAGPDQTVYAWIDGFAVVKSNGSGSFDPDGDELTYRWSWEIEGEVFEANGVVPLIALPVGEHLIELVVFDGALQSEPNSVLVTVVGTAQARGFVVPRVLNLSSRGKYVLAIVYLPDGVQKGDIKGGSFGLHVDGGGGDGIPADRQMVIGGGNKGRVFVIFGRADVIAAIGDRSTVKLYVAGELESGQWIYAEDTIGVVQAKRSSPRRPTKSRARRRKE